MSVKLFNSFSIGGIKLTMGIGAISTIGKEIKSAGVHKVLVITDPGIEKTGMLSIVIEVLEKEKVPYAIFDQVTSDPSSQIVYEALQKLNENDCDGVVGLGGESSMDVAKGVKMMATNEGNIFDYDNSPTGGKVFKNEGLFLICVPTTSGTGSEVTPYAIITNEKEHRKATISSKNIAPSVAILDPEFTVGLPPHITASTGMDALAHAIGGYTSGRVLSAAGDTSLSDMIAYQSIEMIGKYLRVCYACGSDIHARKKMQVASMLGALASNAGSDASHGLGHALGAVYHLPHGVACAVVLPYVMEYNLSACPERFKNIAVALGENVEGLSLMDAAKKSVEAVKKLMQDINIPKLSTYIEKTDDDQFELLCKTAEQEKCSLLNPRPVTKEIARELLLKAM